MVGVGVLGIGVLVEAGEGVVVGRFSVGITIVVDVATTVSLATGEVNSNTLIGVGVPVGCARLTGWQDDNRINNTQAATTLLSTFRVYHKIYR
jgi:hypothetical protein